MSDLNRLRRTAGPEQCQDSDSKLLLGLRCTAVPELADVESICQPGNDELGQNLNAGNAVPEIQDKLERAVQKEEKSSMWYPSKKKYRLYQILTVLIISVVFFISLLNHGAIDEYLFSLSEMEFICLFGGLFILIFGVAIIIYIRALMPQLPKK